MNESLLTANPVSVLSVGEGLKSSFGIPSRNGKQEGE